MVGELSAHCSQKHIQHPRTLTQYRIREQIYHSIIR